MEASNKAALLELTSLHPELVDIRSKANNDTLLIRAFKYLREDIIEDLLILGADISAKDEHGMPATMWIYATERTDLTTEEYDNTALRMSKKYLSLENAKSYSDEYTNLLLNSTKAKFPVDCNNDGYDHTTILTKIIQRNLVQSAEWFIKNFQLNQNETAESLIAGTIRMSSGNLTSTEVRNVEFLLEKHLHLIDENSKCANNLAEMLFQKKFYKEYHQFDMICTEFHRLQSGQSIGHYGYMVYHDIHVLVAKILIKFGIDLQKYESYVENLASVHDSLIPLLCQQINPEDYKSYFEGLPNNVKELLKSELPAEENSEPYDVLEVLDSDDESDYNITIDPYDVFINHRIYRKIQDAFILESTKKKILQLTKVSSILCEITYTKDYEDFHISYEDLPITIDVVLNRLDYLSKKDNAQEFDKQEIEALSNFISNKIILSVTTDEEAIDVCNSFIEYFMNKCNSITRFKEFLNENMLEDKANKALKSILYQTTEDSFKTNISSLATKIAELTDGVVLPLNIDFLSLNNTNSKIVEIDYEKQNLIKNNLKLFSCPNTYRIPNNDKLEELSSEYLSPNVAEYYKNHPEAFEPISMLLGITYDEDKLSKKEKGFSNAYANIKSQTEEMSRLLDIVIYGEDKKAKEQSVTELKQVMSELTQVTHVNLVIQDSVNLCAKLRKYLNITPLELLLKEYQDKYTLLSEEYNNVIELCNEEGIIGNVKMESNSVDL
ncbi:hypothetical protein [Orientia tsutsugamushi]|uniref:Ankyrin repeat-containing protein n=1 Tax=Orientia tsutsugamushi TaxID=784 RepID=A0A2U3R9X5_ORITS|nr:hypothetical protein [Orientia tsutsugamushi]SPR10022.1 ankyrin repeat-containing protein [Orientia tsutsugamushi]